MGGRGLEIEADPRSLGFDPRMLSRLDAFLHQTQSEGRIPGWLLAVSRESQLAHVSLGGYRDLGFELPVEPDTIFRIYSMTKPVTAVAAMMLYELGLFELSDPVARFIPSFGETRVFVDSSPAREGMRTNGRRDRHRETEPMARPLTMLHLLTHTAGLTYGFHRAHPVDELYRQAGHEIQAPDGVTLAEACELWASLPLLFQPGTEWNYSVGTDVLGRVVEILAGQSLGDFCAENIFRPLGMLDTGFFVKDADIPRLARLYGVAADGSLEPADDLGASVLRPVRAHYGGGGLVSTASDYLRFATMLLNKGAAGDQRLLSTATVELMSRNHLPGNADLHQFGRLMNAETPMTGIGQGFGVSVVLDPIRCGYPASVGEIGWGGAASTAFWVDPRLELVVVFMTQVMPAAALPIRGRLHQFIHHSVQR